MKCIVNGRMVLSDQILEGYAIVFDDKIRAIVPEGEIKAENYEIIDAQGQLVMPGLVDLHIHGYLGQDASDGSEEGLRIMAKGLVKNGVTSWCPTTMTVAKEALVKAYGAVRTVRAEKPCGAKILGVNCEGPFINPKKKGAQPEEYILPPDGDFILQHADILKLVTVAPEVEGALDCIEQIAKDGRVVVSMGHTDASCEEAREGVFAGVGHVTHLFNGMTGLHHRDPGVVGVALTADVSCELIADTFHVAPDLFSRVAKLKGDKLCLITDCMRAGGMEDGEYTLGGQKVVKKGIQCLLKDGTIAGSVLKLNEAVRNLKEYTNLSLSEAVACASLNPAKAIAMDAEIGSLEVGKWADIVLCDEAFRVLQTFVDGKRTL